MRIGEIGLEAQRRIEVIECQVVAAGPGRDQPEEMPGIDMAGIRLHDLPAKLLRLLQLAGLIVSPGHIERLWNRDHGIGSKGLGTSDFTDISPRFSRKYVTITPARKNRTPAHTNPKRQRGIADGILADASGWYVSSFRAGVIRTMCTSDPRACAKPLTSIHCRPVFMVMEMS